MSDGGVDVTDPRFATSYGKALAAYVADTTEQRLKAAYDLGRFAVEHGLGILDVAAVHNDVVARAAPHAVDLTAVLQASGDFLIESLATFEMIQRGTTEAWRAASVERRRGRMIRELSAVLADATIASAADESAQELAQIAAEMLREVTDAAAARIVFHPPGARAPIEAAVVEPDVDSRGDDERAKQDVVTTPIRSIDGANYGEVEIVALFGASFRSDDHATVRQVADLTAAWLDRTQGLGRIDRGDV